VKKTLAIAVGAVLGLAMLPAHAGEWRLNQARCTTQVVRYDSRDFGHDQGRGYGQDQGYDRGQGQGYGRQDQGYDSSRTGREDSYGRNERGGRGANRITVCSRGAFVYLPDRWERQHRRFKAPKLFIAYDRQARLNYTLVTGRKIYVRG
jgi:hypothetical protein